MQIKSTLLAACLCAAAPLTSTPTSYTIPIYTGYNLIANQLDAGANTFNQVMPTVPHGTTVWLWDYGNNTFCQAEIFYQGAGWLPNGTWLRGRGGFLQSGVPTYSLAFNGTLNPPVFPPSVPQGFSIIGRQIPSTPTVWDDIAGGPPWLGLDGTTLFRFMQPAGNYADAYTYFDGFGWNSASDQNIAGPILNVGEAVWVNSQTAIGPAVTTVCGGVGNGATVNFANLTPVCDAPVVDTDGVTRLAGPTFKAALFYAPDNGSTPSAGSMVPVGSAVPFMTGARAGYVQGGTVALPTTTPPGSTAYFQLRAWDTTVGGAASSTYQNAVNNGEKVGASAILKIPTGNPGAVPPGTPGLLCLNSFALVSPAATPLGTAVQVQAIDPAAQASVTVTFANVTSAGTTTLQAIPSTAAPSLSAFKITVGTTPVFFELKTTAVFTPPVQVCFSYAGLSFVPNAILHYPVGGPSWSAPFGTVSPSGKTICGTVNSLSPFAVAKLDPVDTDHDGVLDDDDACPNSDLRPTVVIDGCNSGVPNRLLAHGCTISDLIAECATGVKNHGQFVSRVADLTNLLKKQGLITAQQKGAIETCAGKARIGK